MQVILKKKVYTDQNKTFSIDEGSVYIENYNETLDSATIRISHLTEPLDLESFDKVQLVDSRLGPKYMCIDTYDEIEENLDPRLYSYEISLCSETKELEGILLPNISITKRPYDSYRTVWYYLEQYLNLYGEKIRTSSTVTKTYTRDLRMAGSPGTPILQIQRHYDFVKTDDMVVDSVTYTVLKGAAQDFSTTFTSTDTIVEYETSYDSTVRVTITYRQANTYINKYSFDNKVKSKFNSIQCPEMQWNTPTLREVFNDLMMVADCIPVVRNNVISYIDLTEKKNDITNNLHINYVRRSQSAEDYVSELKMNIVNGMSDTTNKTIKSTVITDWMTFRADDNGYLVTSENIYLKTRFPILKVKHLWMYFAAGRRDSSEGGAGNYFKIYKVDLCNITIGSESYRLLYEKSEYDVLPIERWSDYSDNFNEGITKNKSVYYERGNNIISGFATTTKASYKWGDTNTVQWLKLIIAKYGDTADDVYVAPTISTNQFYSTFFKIEYETLANCVFTASKELPVSHNRVIADNQTNSYVNTYTQGFLEYQKANRLGNQQRFINARYEDGFDELIKIGDYYKESIVYQTQYKIYQNHIDVNAIATKDYILRDYFTGVKARVRSWKIATGDEAFERHELDKYYLEFDTNRRTDYINLDYPISYNFLEYFTDYLASIYHKEMNYCCVKISTTVFNYPDASGYSYVTDLFGTIVGNSLVFTFGADDNFEFGKRNKDDIRDTDLAEYTGNHQPRYVKEVGYTDGYGGFPLSPLRYVDDNGECVTIDYTFSRNIASHESSGDNDVSAQFLLETFERPMVLDSRILDTNFIQHKEVFKDNREILKMSVQFEVCSRTRNIVFTKKFLELQTYIRDTDFFPPDRYRIFYKESIGYDFRNTIVPNDANELSINNSNQITVTALDNLSARIRLPNVPGTLATTIYYITDADKNTILMVRGTNDFYLNTLKSRDLNVYNIDRVPIGTI